MAGRNKRESGKKTNREIRKVKDTNKGFFEENKAELIFILSFVISVLLLLSNFNLAGPVGSFINKFLFGIIGLFTWIFPIYFFVVSLFIIATAANKRIVNKVIAATGLFIALGGIVELISYGDLREISWGALYTMSSENKNGGGFIGGAIAKILNLGLAQAGAYLVLIATVIIIVIYLTGKLITNAVKARVTETKEVIVDYTEEVVLDARARAEERIARRKELREIKKAERDKLREERNFSDEVKQEKEFVKPEKKLEDNNDKEKIEKIESIKEIGKEVELKEISKPEKENLSFLIHRAGEDKIEDIVEGKIDDKIDDGIEEKNEEEPFYLKEIENKFGNEEDFEEDKEDLFIQEKLEEKVPEDEPIKGNFWKPEMSDYEGKNNIDIMSVEDDIEEYEDLLDEENEIFDEDVAEECNKEGIEESVENMSEEDEVEQKEEVEPRKSILELEKEMLLEKKTITGNKALESEFGSSDISEEKMKDIVSVQEKNTLPDIEVEKPKEMPKPPKPYIFPPKHLLNKAKGDEEGISDEELHDTARKLQETLAAFGVNVKVTDVSCGPSVTRYELQPEQGVKVSKITALTDDIKLNLAAADIRIEAPIPGKAAVGIEVPNKKNLMVYFRDLIENKAFDEHQSKLAFAVGKDIGGQTMISDIAKMPHLLIAGATGSGKSVCINTLIMSILYKAKPSEVKLIMVDPKVVELSVYNGIPHLMLPVVTDPKKAAAALNWAVAEMNRRYNLFAEKGVREIKGFNKKVGKDALEWMPQIVIIVDELADLMMVSSKEVEEAICRLAQLARAAGIHLVIATQRPSVNVITGLIKANVPSRVAFAVSSQVDSRTILDGAGAEKLLGKGDMLFFPSGYPKPVRVQGAFISDSEVSDVVEFIISNNDSSHKGSDITEQINTVQAESSKAVNQSSETKDDYDEYFDEAGRYVIGKDKATIGMFQRVYKVGFNRAARIMDQLAEAGVVGEDEGTKPRKIIMSKEEFEEFVNARHSN